MQAIARAIKVQEGILHDLAYLGSRQKGFAIPDIEGFFDPLSTLLGLTRFRKMHEFEGPLIAYGGRQ